MARIMINCPETGEPVFTGMSFDWSSFESVKIGEKLVRCSACGDERRNVVVSLAFGRVCFYL